MSVVQPWRCCGTGRNRCAEMLRAIEADALKAFAGVNPATPTTFNNHVRNERMKMKKNNTGSWIVKVECVVEKEVICDHCTEQQAYENPFRFAVDEREICQVDWNVKSVEENV